MAFQNNIVDVSTMANWRIEPTRMMASSSNNSFNHNNELRDFTKLRYWENMDPSLGESANKNGFPFRIISYNILAQLLLEFHSYLYQNCSQNSLLWNMRFARIYNEIKMLNPDVICLQELQSSHVELFNTQLKKLNYDYIYKQRTGIRVDGCAIFYKTKKFDLIDQQSVEFRQPNTDILNRDNIGLMAKLKPKIASTMPFVVCTTHLLFNPKRSDVRLAQVQVFLAEIDRFSFYSDRSNRQRHLPIIITGDFNSLPNSPVIRLLSEGLVHFQHSGLKNIAITDLCQHLGVYLKRKRGMNIKEHELSMLHHSEKAIVISSDEDSEPSFESDTYMSFFNRGRIKHKFSLKSVYDFVKSDMQREVTTHQDEWVTVDYIFYSSGNLSDLQLKERYRLPTENECTNMGAIPNEYFGSDHFSLAAGFIISPTPPMSSV